MNIDKHVSAQEPDWSREYKPVFSWDPGRSLLASIRSFQRYDLTRGHAAKLTRHIALIRHRFWTVVTGADIPPTTRIDGGLLLPHPNGIVIHPSVRIGPNCLIFQQVTLGTAGGDGVPIIGGHVDIGAGAKILGAVTIGDHARIGANAVVLKDVPAGGTAVGVPAVIIHQR